MSLRRLSCPSDFRISPLTTKTPVSSVQSNFLRRSTVCVCIHLKFSFTVPHAPMFVITFTERGLIHKVTYKFRDDLYIPLVFPSQKRSCHYKNCTLYFILIFSLWWNILWVPQEPICHWFIYSEAQLSCRMWCVFFIWTSPTAKKENSFFRTVGCGYMLYKPVFSSLLALNSLPLLIV